MYTTIVKKFTSLLAVYAVVIVGIFVLQFKRPVPKAEVKYTPPVEKPIPVVEQEVSPSPPPFTFSAFTDAVLPVTDALLSISTKEAYSNTLSNIEQSVVSSFNHAMSAHEEVTEADVVAFIAASAQGSTADEAIERVPPQIKRASYRTYLSSPYFGSLSSTYRFLEAALTNCRNILASIEGDSEKAIAALSTERMTDYILLNPSSPPVVSALKTIENASTLTVDMAASVLLAYSKLNGSAAALKDIVSKCFDTIEGHITIEDGVLSVTNTENTMSAIKTGAALIKAGEALGNDSAAAAGRAIVNSYYAIGGFTLHELSEMEELLVCPPHYPHLQVLSDGVYAFTCANSVEYKEGRNEITIETDSSVFSTHYMIVSGIKPFSEIYIYGIPFHTDIRFETYNSSGFVYVSATNTLLLKNRQKGSTEEIRLVYNKG